MYIQVTKKFVIEVLKNYSTMKTTLMKESITLLKEIHFITNEGRVPVEIIEAVSIPGCDEQGYRLKSQDLSNVIDKYKSLANDLKETATETIKENSEKLESATIVMKIYQSLPQKEKEVLDIVYQSNVNETDARQQAAQFLNINMNQVYRISRSGINDIIKGYSQYVNTLINK